MVKGSNRKLFRKPGMARRAIGILASSPELAQAANRNMPVRLQGGGDPLFEQARQQARYMLSRPNVSYGMNEDQMTQSIYQNLLSQKQGAGMSRADQLKAAGQDFLNRNPADVSQLGAFSLDTSPFARNAAGLPTRTPTDVSDMTMPELYELRRELGGIGYFRSPTEKQGVDESRQRVADAIASGRETSKLFTEVENMVDSDVLMEQVMQDQEARKSPDNVTVDDVINSERVSPLRPYGYEPGGLPEDSAFGTKTRKRLTQIEQVLADDDKADKDSKLSSTRRGELQAELKELNRLDVGQDKFFRDVGIPEFSDKNYKQNEDQIKQIESRIESQIRRRDKGIENKNEKLINSANEEIDRLNTVRDGALLDRAFMDNQKGESPQEQVVNAENENALLESLNKAQNSLLDGVQLNRPEDLDNVGPDQVSLSGGSPAATITNIDVVGKFIVETDDEVTPDDKENAKEILREQGQPPELADRPDFWHYVTMAGLGIAAGESDNALTNVAKGLLMGLDQKARDDKDYRKEGYERWLAGEKLNLEKQNVGLSEEQLRIQGIRAETGRLTAQAQLERLTKQDINTFDEQFAQSIRDRVPDFPNPFEYVKSNEQRREALNEDFILSQARKHFDQNTDATSVVITGPGETKTVFYDPEKKEISFTKPKKQY